MEAVGLASSIITLVDLAYKIIRGTHEIYSSSSGALEEHDHTARVLRDLRAVTESLDGHTFDGVSDPHLDELTRGCRELSGELVDLLNQFLPKGPGRLQAFRASWRIMRKEKRAVSLENRLDRYRQQISQHLIVMLFEQQSPARADLNKVRRNAQKLSDAHSRRIEGLMDQLQTNLKLAESSPPNTTAYSSGVDARLDEFHEKLHKLDSLENAASHDMDNKLSDIVQQLQRLNSFVTSSHLLRRLFFPSMFQREDSVLDPTAETFGWILGSMETEGYSEGDSGTPDEPRLRRETSTLFVNFLRGLGDTVFICGKAGCGKSTFMKYVAHNHEVRGLLKEWAGTSRLAVIPVFFWKSGDTYQSSMEGFWRTILFQLLSQCPELINQLFPHATTDDAVPEFRLPELENAFRCLGKLPDTDNYRFACFIDGLDEHEGDNLSHRELARKLTTWASSPNVKIICSARPYTVFIDTFKAHGNIIEFHKLTRGDICNFAETSFRTSLADPGMELAQENCIGLVDKITERAEGVFSWATLVVRALINQAMDHDYSAEALSTLLSECPSELETLFEKMLMGVNRNKRDQTRSNMVLYLAALNPFDSPLSILAYWWLDELDYFGQSGPGKRLSSCPSNAVGYEETSLSGKRKALLVENRKDRVKQLLHQITQGLLEVTTTKHSMLYLSHNVQFYHLSVRDFLREQWNLGHRESPFGSSHEAIDAYCRLRSLEARELAFSRTLPGTIMNSWSSDTPEFEASLRSFYEDTFRWLAVCAREGSEPSTACLYDFGTAWECLQSQFPVGRWFLVGLLRVQYGYSGRDETWRAPDGLSFLHWIAYWGLAKFVRAQLGSTAPGTASVDSALRRNDLNLLLSSSLASDVETTRFLLQSPEHHPHDLVLTIHYIMWKRPGGSGLWLQDGREERAITSKENSVWLVFLRDLANQICTHCKSRLQSTHSRARAMDRGWQERLARVVEAHLQAGADPNVYFVVNFEWPHTDLEFVLETQDHFEECLSRAFRVDLIQILSIFKPQNLSRLEQLLPRSDEQSLVSSGITARCATADMLLNSEWEPLGVRSESGEELMGLFDVRAF